MAAPGVIFTDHAIAKFEVLAAQGIHLSRDEVAETVRNPASVTPGYGSRLVAQKTLDAEKVLRVVYEQTAEGLVVVTFYPGRRSRYE